jgi:hypothetical protein
MEGKQMKNKSPDRDFYSRSQFAEKMGLSESTVTRDCTLGRIRCVRYGIRVLIPHAELLRIGREGMPVLTTAEMPPPKHGKPGRPRQRAGLPKQQAVTHEQTQ